MSSPQDLDTRCAVCGRWIKSTRVGYLVCDHYLDMHEYPLCPSCHELGTVLALWMARLGQVEATDIVAAARLVWAHVTRPSEARARPLGGVEEASSNTP